MNEQFSAFLDNEASRDEADSAVNALLRDESLRESWSRQYWLRTTLRSAAGEPAVALDDGFSTRVMEAIGGEGHAQTPHMTTSPNMTPRLITASARRRRRWRNRAASVAAVASVTGIALLIGSPLQRPGSAERSTSEAVASSASSTDSRSTSTSPDRGALVPTFETGSAVASSFMQAPSQPQSLSTSQTGSLTRGLDISSVTPSQQILADGTGSAQAAAAATRPVSQGPADNWSVSDPALQDELNGYLVDHNGMSRGYGLSGTTPALVRVATYGQETTQ